MYNCLLITLLIILKSCSCLLTTVKMVVSLPPETKLICYEAKQSLLFIILFLYFVFIFCFHSPKFNLLAKDILFSWLSSDCCAHAIGSKPIVVR